jgi:hypothetical protein
MGEMFLLISHNVGEIRNDVKFIFILAKKASKQRINRWAFILTQRFKVYGL